MAKTYGVGIMGAGNISAAYLRLAPLFKGLEVRAVADILPEAAKKRAEEFGVAAQTPDELLKNSEIDVIVNLTIPSTHYSVSSEILSAGKHAYSEKPFVLTLEEGKALKKQADERKLKVGSAPDTFLGGAHQQARSIIDSGKLGKIASGTMHVMSRGMEHWHPNPDFFFQVGGGPILDLGPYYITDLISLVGPVKRVTAFTGMARAEREVTAEGPYKGTMIKVGTPTTIHAILEFQNGAIITLGASWDVSSHGHHNIELYGTEGSIYVPDPNFFGGDVTITDRDGDQGEGDAVGPPVRQGQPGSRQAGAARQLPQCRPQRHDGLDRDGQDGAVRHRRGAACHRRHGIDPQGRRNRPGDHADDDLRAARGTRSGRGAGAAEVKCHRWTLAVQAWRMPRRRVAAIPTLFEDNSASRRARLA